MTKKGFTLIEVLAVVVILGILSAIVIPSVFTMMRKATNNAYNILVESFEENARLYATRHRDEVESSLDAYNYFTLTLNDLREDNLLKTPINDPRTNEIINLTKKIIITRETDKSLAICFEDKGCYIPILLVNELTKESNIVEGVNEGLHYASLDDVYYYRGGNPSNWLEFNGLLWRIVKINSDGTIKLIYEGTKNTTGTNQDGVIYNAVFDYSISNNYNNALSVKIGLQNWYEANILEKNRNKVHSTNWCIGKTTYDTNGTLKETFMSNECSSQTALPLPIGLVSGLDYLFAGLDTNCLSSYKITTDYGNSCKNSNYLYKSDYNYWSITGDNTGSNVWEIKSSGSLGAPVAANNLSGVRPVINLISSVIIDRGNGTFDSPYSLKEIVNVDKEKPVITVLGNNPITIEQGSTYVDAGATAVDNVDGDITNKIIILSNVNINVLGNYTITYVVSDTSGNKRSVSRIVNVIEKEGNVPVLATGMTPVKWNGSAWVTTTASDANWYHYTTTDKQWANAQTVDGSMWVWIPRYVYRISTGWHSSTTGTIDVQFSMGTDDTRGGTVALDTGTTADASNNKWTNHPAFTFGTTELTGIWVAKFEASGTTSTVDIKPNVASLRSTTISNMFTATRSMETNSRYGWGTSGTGIDTHLMKNIEWGAAAYLSKSSYGKNAEIWINPANTYTTGCAGDSVSSASTTGCLRTYDTANGQQASTTGNIYGIYDMSGGAWEYTAGYVNNGNASLTTYGSSIINADIKYKDVYTVTTDSQTNNYTNAINKKGDAVYETSSTYSGSTSWYSDYSYMPYSSAPGFLRGGYYYHTTRAGAFYFVSFIGYDDSSVGFRVVVAVEDGL